MNRLPLSAEAFTAADANRDQSDQCDYPDCARAATGYLFMRAQFCDEHRDFYLGRDPAAKAER